MTFFFFFKQLIYIYIYIFTVDTLNESTDLLMSLTPGKLPENACLETSSFDLPSKTFAISS